MNGRQTLPIKYRPGYLDEFLGSPTLIKTLKSLIGREYSEIPASWLFYGPAGCGKTTLARIIKNELECSDLCFYEYNASNTRGIDTIRQIQEASALSPMMGEVKAFLLDECFHKDTPITTIEGKRKISEIKRGDKIENIYGIDTVEWIKKNKVSLDRLCCVTFENGIKNYTTVEHLFRTSSGWKEAKNLDNEKCLCSLSKEMRHTELLREGKKNGCEKQEIQSGLFNLSKTIYRRNTKQKILSRMHDFNLSFLWEKIHSKGAKQTFLFKKLFGKGQIDPSRNKEKTLFKRDNKEQGKKEAQNIDAHRKGKIDTKKMFRKDEKEQSWFGSKSTGQSVNHQTHKRDFRWLEKQSWRQWEGVDRITKNIIEYFRKTLDCRISYKNSYAFAFGGTNTFLPKKSNSNKLQSRLGKSQIKTGHRNRWIFPSLGKKEGTRQEKGKSSEGIRVESVEIYKRGSNDKSFKGIIGDKERDQGFIEMYDLQIENHPSYIANDVIVHNCHMLTKDAQNAILKLLEDPPKDTFFLLATTDPEKLIKPIHSRCTKVGVAKLSSRILIPFLKDVCTQEGVELPDTIFSAISKSCGGVPRDALKILDSILDLETEEEMLETIQEAYIDEESLFDFCKMLLDHKVSWAELVPQIKARKEEAETIRRGILGIFNAFLLNSKTVEEARSIAEVMECFEEAYYNTGHAGFSMSCLRAKLL